MNIQKCIIREYFAIDSAPLLISVKHTDLKMAMTKCEQLNKYTHLFLHSFLDKFKHVTAEKSSS